MTDTIVPPQRCVPVFPRASHARPPLTIVLDPSSMLDESLNETGRCDFKTRVLELAIRSRHRDKGTMRPIPLQQIPQWLYQEVDQYFIPLPFQPATILDIGANIGAFAQRARQKWPDAKMICCEPMPFNVVQLRKNVTAETVIISAAIREQSGVDEIFAGDNFVTGGFVAFGR